MADFPPGVVITEVRVAGADLEAVRDLLHEYGRSDAVQSSAQDYDGELAALPGVYASPAGCLWLARLGGMPAGCVALRGLDAKRCETKRLYVRAAFRGAGLAGILIDGVIARARVLGYDELYLDTLLEMRAARLIYEMLGFRACAPYLPDPTPGAECMVLDLTG